MMQQPAHAEDNVVAVARVLYAGVHSLYVAYDHAMMMNHIVIAANAATISTHSTLFIVTHIAAVLFVRIIHLCA